MSIQNQHEVHTLIFCKVLITFRIWLWYSFFSSRCRGINSYMSTRWDFFFNKIAGQYEREISALMKRSKITIHNVIIFFKKFQSKIKWYARKNLTSRDNRQVFVYVRSFDSWNFKTCKQNKILCHGLGRFLI